MSFPLARPRTIVTLVAVWWRRFRGSDVAECTEAREAQTKARAGTKGAWADHLDQRDVVRRSRQVHRHHLYHQSDEAGSDRPERAASVNIIKSGGRVEGR